MAAIIHILDDENVTRTAGANVVYSNTINLDTTHSSTDCSQEIYTDSDTVVYNDNIEIFPRENKRLKTKEELEYESLLFEAIHYRPWLNHEFIESYTNCNKYLYNKPPFLIRKHHRKECGIGTINFRKRHE